MHWNLFLPWMGFWAITVAVFGAVMYYVGHGAGYDKAMIELSAKHAVPQSTNPNTYHWVVTVLSMVATLSVVYLMMQI